MKNIQNKTQTKQHKTTSVDNDSWTAIKTIYLRKSIIFDNVSISWKRKIL